MQRMNDKSLFFLVYRLGYMEKKKCKIFLFRIFLSMVINMENTQSIDETPCPYENVRERINREKKTKGRGKTTKFNFPQRYSDD